VLFDAHLFVSPAMHTANKSRRERAPKGSAGRTLIELIIAMAIGFIVLGAVMLTSISTSRSGSANEQLRRLQEDAALAAYVLNQALRLGGYSEPAVYPTGGNSIGNYAGPGVVGCDGGFGDLKTGAYDTLTCVKNAPGNAPDAISILYEATAENSATTAGGVPTDCRGIGIFPNTPAPDGRPPFSLADLRFYIAQDAQTGNPALHCAGSGGAPGNATGNQFVGAALVDNVEDMQITYGVADVPPPRTPYPVGTIGPDGVWPRVVSARICLLLRSEDNAFDEPAPFTDCQGVTSTPGDRRARRLVHITTTLYNRTAACADPTAAPGLPTEQKDGCDVSRFSPASAPAP
jgi:type IV pilus assembly protein PilW